MIGKACRAIAPSPCRSAAQNDGRRALQAASRRQHFPDGEPAVLAAAPLSRCLYAQLALQRQESSGAAQRSRQVLFGQGL